MTPLLMISRRNTDPPFSPPEVDAGRESVKSVQISDIRHSPSWSNTPPRRPGRI